MLAQLLGMGRGKKEKDRERDKEPASHKTDGFAEGGAGHAGAKEIVALANGTPASSDCVVAAKTGQKAAALRLNNGGGFTGDATIAGHADAACECCRRKDEENVDGSMDIVDQARSEVGAASSLAPKPPSGPTGFSNPDGATALVAQQALGTKAFAMEVAAVERGLHIQLGEVGAKTEAQLGGLQLEAAKRLRHLLSGSRERTMHELLSRRWVPLLLRWLGLVHRPNLQVEALAALTTVAQITTEHTPLLLKHGAVGTLVGLLKSPSLELVEQAMWVLGKMAQDGQDGTTARDAVLQAGVLGPLVRCLEQHPTLLSLQRIGAWSLFNLFDGQPRPTVDVPTVNTVMPAINRLLRAADSEVLSHACSALSHICDGCAAYIKVVVESGVCKRLVQLLDHPSWQVVKPALRTIGNVVCAEDDADYTEAILEAGSVMCLKRLIAHPNREIQKEACWTLSNIAAGSVSQIQSVLDSGAMPQVIKLATSGDTESEVRSEAFWVVLNAASCGSDAQVEYLVSQGCVQILSDLLEESSMVMMALEGIERVLSVGDLHVRAGTFVEVGGTHCIECAHAAVAASGDGGGGGLLSDSGMYTNPYACMLAPEKIQALEAHKNSTIAKRASRVWARYFVKCAICESSFTRHGGNVEFCVECKCHVCDSCNCTVFHLDYQDKLWQEMEGKEKKGKQAQQAAKKNKKAKKREKKKNAAKEPVLEPSKENKANSATGEVGGKRDAMAVPRAEGVSSKGKVEGIAMQRPHVLGDKPQPNRRSPSPHKASSIASTESNSEDEYRPSSPNTNAYHNNNSNSSSNSSPAVATSTAAAIISATAAAVTAAVKLSTPPKAAASTPPKALVSPTDPGPAPTLVSPANGARSKAAEGERRRPGKKQGRRDQPADGTVAASVSPPLTVPPSNAGKVADDDNEEPWVVVGSRAGGGGAQGGAGAGSAAGVKQPKRKKGQRGGDSGAGGVATLPGGGGGASVVEWASESSPASTARAVVSRSKVVSPSRAAAAPRVNPQAPPAATPVQAVAPGGGGGGVRSGNGNPWRVAQKTASPPRVAPSVVVASPAVAANGLRSTTGGTSGAHFAPQRPGPGPGSVWGASAPMVELRTKPLFATVAPLPGASAEQSSRAPGPRNRAGVIGPPQAAVGGSAPAPRLPPAVTAAAAVLKPLGPSALLPAAQVLAHRPLAASINKLAAPTLSGIVCSGDGVVGDRPPSPAAVPSSISAAQGEGGSGAVVRTSSCGGDGEALVENEKLVSYLMETGSILALAQRLEEEEEWRRAAPSPANCGPG